MDYLKNCESSIYCIGGGQIYNEAIKFPTCKRIYFTQVHGIMNCDTFLTKVDEYDFTKLSDKETDNILNWTLPRSRVENDIQYEFLIYERQGNKENVV